jgi:hypothetical protein
METKSRDKLILIGLGVCAGLYVLYLVVVTPVYNVWLGRQKDIANLRKTINSGQSMIQQSDLIDSNWNHVNLNTLSSNPTMAESKLFQSFAGWALNTGVTLIGQKPEPKDNPDDDTAYRNYEWHADVTGNEQQIERFLYAVESSSLGLKVEEVDITSRDDFGRQLALGLTVSGLILIDNNNATQ